MFPSTVLLASCLLAMSFSTQPGSIGSCGVSVVSDDSSGIVLTFTSVEAQLTPVMLDGNEFIEISLDGEGRIGRRGLPDLPAVTRNIIIPAGTALRLEVISDDSTIQPLTSSPVLFNLEDLDVSQAISSLSDPIFPPEPVVLRDIQNFRGWQIQPITIYPCQYNINRRELIHHEHLKIAIHFENAIDLDCQPKNNRPCKTLTRDTYRFLNALTLNPPQRDDNGACLPRGGYMIVVGTRFEQDRIEDQVNRLAAWKRACGHHVEIAWDQCNADRILDNFIRPGYEDWDPPLEFVCVIGVYTNIRAPDTYHDVKFGFLEGGNNDHVAEVAVSRLSADSDNQVHTVIERALGYQLEPYVEDMGWFYSAGAVAQEVRRWSMSVNYTVKWIAEAERRAGFDNVQTWICRENNGSASDAIIDWLRDGVNIIFERGGSRIRNYPNSEIFPMYITVGGGHVEDNWQALWDLGSPNHPQGPSVISGCRHRQETISSNVIIGGMARSLLVERLPIGWARAFGMLMLDYGGTEGRGYDYYAQELSMYGEPSQVVWRGRPTILDVIHPQTFSTCQNHAEIEVYDRDMEEAVPNALVTIIQNDDFYVEEFTDNEGLCTIMLDPDLEGTVVLTVSGDNLLPYHREIRIEDQRLFVGATRVIINDEDGGNGDGRFNPGETVEMRVIASNFGNRDIARNVAGVVNASTSWVTVENNNLHFGDINTGEEAQSQETVEVHVTGATPDEVDLGLYINLTSGREEWTSFLPVDLIGARLEIEEVMGEEISEDEASPVQIRLRNTGRLSSPRMQARLTMGSVFINVLEGQTEYNSIRPNQNAPPVGSQFSVSANPLAIPGNRVPMLLLISPEGERVPDTLRFELQIGREHANAPQGPDDYGYVCFDDTDNGWEQSPDYDWIEINPDAPDADFEGTALIRNREENFTRQIELPFQFNYYGEIFNEITISENGFIAFGDDLSELGQYENFPLDRSMNGSFGMVAPYWDDIDIIPSNNSRNIFTHYDDDEDMFIIEWSRVLTYMRQDRFTFEIILYNPEVYETPTGDGLILFQYHTIGTPSGEAPQGFSAGICSPDGRTGINYVADNEYPVTSARIESGRALMFSSCSNETYGYMQGTVFRVCDNEPLSGASIQSTSGISALTDSMGHWVIEAQMTGIGRLTAHYASYLDSTIEYRMGVNDSLEFVFGLLNPEFTFDREAISVELETGHRMMDHLTISNTGNGPMHFTTRFEYLPPNEEERHPARDERWDLLMEIPVTELTDDAYILGVEFIDGYFYITGNKRLRVDYPHYVYRFNREGILLDTLVQPCRGAWGFKEITFDGEYIIGGDGSDIVFVDPQTMEEVHRFRSPLGMTPALTYDPDEELLYIGVFTNGESIVKSIRYDIGVDEFEEVSTYRIINPYYPERSDRIYGLAWHRNDPDDCQLYILQRALLMGDNNPFGIALTKIDVNTAEQSAVTIFDSPDPGSRPGGLTITGKWDARRLVVAYIEQDRNREDFLMVRELAPNSAWLTVDPMLGDLNPLQEMQMSISIDATDLWHDEFGVRCLFSELASDRQAELPITLLVDSLAVIDEQPQTAFQFDLIGFYPNPLNGMGTVDFTLIRAGEVRLTIYDIQGREMISQTAFIPRSGRARITVDSVELPAGIYLGQIQTGSLVKSFKIAVVK